jgi:hypothetical protein
VRAALAIVRLVRISLVLNIRKKMFHVEHSNN